MVSPSYSSTILAPLPMKTLKKKKQPKLMNKRLGVGELVKLVVGKISNWFCLADLNSYEAVLCSVPSRIS